jgi:hypothetical protein
LARNLSIPQASSEALKKRVAIHEACDREQAVVGSERAAHELAEPHEHIRRPPPYSKIAQSGNMRGLVA